MLYVDDYLCIEELELGVRAYNILKRMGVNYCGELAQVTPFDLQHFYDHYDPGADIAICGKALQDIVDAQLILRPKQ